MPLRGDGGAEPLKNFCMDSAKVTGFSSLFGYTLRRGGEKHGLDIHRCSFLHQSGDEYLLAMGGGANRRDTGKDMAAGAWRSAFCGMSLYVVCVCRGKRRSVAFCCSAWYRKLGGIPAENSKKFFPAVWQWGIGFIFAGWRYTGVVYHDTGTKRDAISVVSACVVSTVLLFCIKGGGAMDRSEHTKAKGVLYRFHTLAGETDRGACTDRYGT